MMTAKKATRRLRERSADDRYGKCGNRPRAARWPRLLSSSHSTQKEFWSAAMGAAVPAAADSAAGRRVEIMVIVRFRLQRLVLCEALYVP